MAAAAPDFRLARTIDVPPRCGMQVNLRLRSGEHGFAVIRAAGTLSSAPIAHAVLTRFHTQATNLRKRRLNKIPAIEIWVGLRDDVEIDARPIKGAWRLLRLAARFGQGMLDDGLSAAAGRRGDFERWRHRYDRAGPADRAALDAALAAAGREGGVDIHAYNPGPTLRARIARHDHVALLPGGRPGEILSRPGAALAVVVEDGATMEPDAPALLAGWLARHRDVAMVYGDAQERGPDGAARPLFAARFDEVAARYAPGFQARGVAGFRRGLTPSSVAECASLEQVAAQIASLGGKVAHLPAVLSEAAVAPRLAAAAPRPQTARIAFIIPSRDNPAMLERAVRSLSASTRGFDVRFVIVDHASVQPATARALADLCAGFPLDVVRADGEFNFSRLMNLGRAHAVADILFSVNDDIEALDDNWLGPLRALLQDPAVGAAGPQLRFPDGRIQHAGLVLGLDGVAAHRGRLLAPADPRLSRLGAPIRQVGAVTGAVLGARAEVWDRVGGWSEDLAVEFNDVDFCLKVAALGLCVVYCGQSVLTHHESVSRRDPHGRRWAQMQADHNVFLQRQWRSLAYDPWHSANLAIRGTDLSLAHPPRRPDLRGLLDVAGD